MFSGVKNLIPKIAARSPESLQPNRQDVFLGLSPLRFHEIAYVEWGPVEDARPVICLHGSTRQGLFRNTLLRQTYMPYSANFPRKFKVIGTAAIVSKSL
jgi:hypothetical protein